MSIKQNRKSAAKFLQIFEVYVITILRLGMDNGKHRGDDQLDSARNDLLDELSSIGAFDDPEDE